MAHGILPIHTDLLATKGFFGEEEPVFSYVGPMGGHQAPLKSTMVPQTDIEKVTGSVTK